ncbi:MAG: helix-turn-helix domain-containing protein [Holosporaceae bacterium]|nr:helix-turn-helix domain-containing protein [Holosporaceae bacterium]
MVKYFVSEGKGFRTDLDSYMGSRVKARRSFLGMSQEKLGKYLGVTFQQIQKYEKGSNRISASTLYNIARVLAVDISFFVEGYGSNAELRDEVGSDYRSDLVKEKETSELLKSYYRIEMPSLRRKVSELVKTIAVSQKKQNERDVDV